MKKRPLPHIRLTMFPLFGLLIYNIHTIIWTTVFHNWRDGGRGSIINISGINRAAREVQQFTPCSKGNDWKNIVQAREDFYIWTSPEEIFMLVFGTTGEEGQDIWVRIFENAFDGGQELWECDPNTITFTKGVRNSPCKNYGSSSELSKHPVHNVRNRNCLSSEENDKSKGKNVDEGMEVPNCIGGLIGEGGWRFRIKTAVKCRRENRKYSEVQDVEKSLLRWQNRDMST